MEDKKYYRKRCDSLFTDYNNNWRDHQKEISQYVWPRKGRFLDMDIKPNDGKKRHNDVVDGTAIRALRVLAAGMQGGLTSPARPWFRLALADRDLMKYAPVRIWLEEVRRRMLFVFSKSNFYNVTHSIYGELGGFGTAAMAILSDYSSVIRCYPFTAGEYAVAVDGRGRVNALARVQSLTVAAVASRFGTKNMSVTLKAMYDNKQYDEWVKIGHVVEPNYERNPDGLFAKDMPVASVYFEYGTGDTEKLLEMSGYKRFPIMVPRWDVTGSEVYGRGPGMDALADIKMLKKMREKKLIALDKVVDPPMIAPSSLKDEPKTVVPGGVTYVDVIQGQQGFAPAYEINPNFAAIGSEIREVQIAIRECFFEDLFLMLANTDRRQITATEVVERHEEKMLMVGPVIERIQPELLDRAIDRTYDIMDEVGLLPDPPSELHNMELEVEYISLLAQAQKMMGITAIEQTAGFVGNLAAVKPEVVDKFDADEAVDQYADMVGISPKIIVANKDVREIRRARAQQEQMMQQAEATERSIAGAKTLSEIDMGENNALTNLLGGQQR
jgi:hypothetical protein